MMFLPKGNSLEAYVLDLGGKISPPFSHWMCEVSIYINVILQQIHSIKSVSLVISHLLLRICGENQVGHSSIEINRKKCVNGPSNGCELLCMDRMVIWESKQTTVWIFGEKTFSLQFGWDFCLLGVSLKISLWVMLSFSFSFVFSLEKLKQSFSS